MAGQEPPYIFISYIRDKTKASVQLLSRNKIVLRNKDKALLAKTA